MKIKLTQSQASIWFRLFIALHLFFWTLMPTLVRPTIMHDVAEGIAWGWQWQLGYNKHPPLTAWLCGFITHLFGSVTWPVYLLAQLAVILAFWAVWRLALKVTTPLYALISVLCLEGVIYYNIASVKFTPDTIQTPLWAFITFVFYLAVKDQKWRHWMMLGLLASLALWAKYQAPVLFASLFVILCVTQEGRRTLSSFKPYAALLLMLVLFLPHAIWAYHNHFPEIGYMLNSTTSGHAAILSFWDRHVRYADQFVISELGAVAALILMLSPFYVAKRSENTLPTFEKRFLFWAALGPFLISILYSVIMGSALVHRWAFPYFSFLGLWLITVIVRPQITVKNVKTFLLFFFVIAFSALIGRYLWLGYIGPYWRHDVNADAYYPAQDIANKATAFWHQHYNTPLSYIAGSHYTAAYIAVYSKDHPTPLLGWRLNQSEWVNIHDFYKKGGMLAWLSTCNNADYRLPAESKKLFPQATLLPLQVFPQKINAFFGEKCIGMAIVPPARSFDQVG